MKSLSLLQFGDVHLSEKTKELAADRKDGRFSHTFAESAAPVPVLAALSAAVRVAEKRADLSAIAVTGDLTDYGDPDAYDQCVALLRSAFSHLPVWREGNCFVVPGNHDVEREHPSDRFARVKAAWHPEDWIAVERLQWKEIGLGGARISFGSLNSCVGCGEWWGFPEEIKEDLVKLLEEYTKKHAKSVAFSLIGERLDTPAFRHEDLDEFLANARAGGAPDAHILLAHHGLLPQARVRIALYTELLNGGFARTRLLTLPAPVVYLHGHIHADPVEVIESPKTTGRIISVASPKLEDGFNLVTLMFSDTGFPFGLEITEYRNPGHGGFDPLHHHQYTFITPEQAHNACDTSDRLLLDQLGQSYVRMGDLHDGLSSGTNKDLTDGLEERLARLRLLGLIKIENVDSATPLHWQIRRTGP